MPLRPYLAQWVERHTNEALDGFTKHYGVHRLWCIPLGAMCLKIFRNDKSLDSFFGRLSFQGGQTLLHGLQSVAQPDGAHTGRRDKDALFAQFIAGTHLFGFFLLTSNSASTPPASRAV